MSYQYESPLCVEEEDIQFVKLKQDNNCQPQDGYSFQEPTSITNLQLPPPNMSCYQEPPVPRGEVKYIKHEEAVLSKTITQNFNATNTVIKENTIHHQHNKTVITNVNRNHWHTQRIVVKDNHFHHHLVNNVIKVNDVHHQKIEQVRGEGKTFNDFKQTQRIEAPLCIREGQLEAPCQEQIIIQQNNCQDLQQQQQQQQQQQTQYRQSSSSTSTSHQHRQERSLSSHSFIVNEAAEASNAYYN